MENNGIKSSNCGINLFFIDQSIKKNTNCKSIKDKKLYISCAEMAKYLPWYMYMSL